MALDDAAIADSQTPLLPDANVGSNYNSVDNAERLDDGGVKSAHSPGDVEEDVLPERSAIGRHINWKSAYILTISRVLGSGIFATPGVILAAVGSPGLALTLWVVGSAIAYFGLTVSLELGCMLPRSGGDKVYLEFIYRRPKYLASVLIAVHSIFLTLTASNCIIFAQYTLFACGVEGTEFQRKLIAVGLLTWITIVHSCFRKTGIAIQNLLGWLKIGIVIFMILCGLFVVAFRPKQHSELEGRQPPSLDWSWNGLWAGSILSWGAIATSIIKVFYSYAGLDNLGKVLNEVKDPVRTYRSAALTALITACSMYALVNVAYFLVVPIEEVRNSGELVAALFFERVFNPTIGRRILPLMVALSGVGNVMVVTFAYARLNQEIARTGLIPGARFLSTTAPFGTPLGGLIIHYIPSALVLTVPTGDVYSFILEVEGYPSQYIALMVAAGLIWLRYERPDLKRPYRAWLLGVVIRIAIAFGLLLAPFFPSEAQSSRGVLRGAAYALVGWAVLLFGILYWYIFAKLLPRWRHYRLEDQMEVLDDGTTIRKVARIPE